MQNPIYTQVVAASYTRDRNDKEALTYKLQVVHHDHPHKSPSRREVKWDIIQSYIEQIRSQVHNLLMCSSLEQQRNKSGVDEPARKLSEYILPEKGFVDFIPSGVHPQLDVALDAASEIPWEVLEEYHYVCPECGHHSDPFLPLSDEPPYCSSDGNKMKLAGGKLALTYHLTHLARDGEGRVSGQARDFLIIEDPTGELCKTETDQSGVCAQHLHELQNLLKKQGYRIILFSGGNATSSRVLDSITDGELAGIYYFGHGQFSQGGQEGSIMLADRPLYASEIEGVAPTPRLVFLNACEGAAINTNWDLDRRPSSVASAFAKGGLGKVVIAPMWPVVNTQAAKAALIFFREACSSAPLGEALRTTRQQSLDDYEAGQPDICWMAYRYFGDPNKRLPVPNEIFTEVTQYCRVFDREGRLNMDIFSFLINEVLLRAAKRMNLQHRKRVTVSDMVAGLVRKGDLTRYVLRSKGIDPDILYERIGEYNEAEDEIENCQDHGTSEAVTACNTDEGDPEQKLRRLLAMWIIRQERQFHPKLIGLLVRADASAQQRNSKAGDSPISEKDVLVELIFCNDWISLSALDLPSAESVRDILREREQRDEIDENGAICLDTLEGGAKRIIQSAHALAQKRGVCPITNRVLLAAFLADENGYGATVCRHAGIKQELLFFLMLAAIDENTPAENAPQSFGLSPEACARIVMPVLQEALQIASDPHSITEQELFQAFCEKADSNFKEWLRQLPISVDLEKLEKVDFPVGETESSLPMESTPKDTDKDSTEKGYNRVANGDDKTEMKEIQLKEDFAPSVLRVIERSIYIARNDRWEAVMSPHLFAAMIDYGIGPLNTFFQKRNVPSKKLKSVILSALSSKGSQVPDSEQMGISPHTGEILNRSKKIAASEGRQMATETDLFSSFFADGGGVVGEILKGIGLEALVRSGSGIIDKERYANKEKDSILDKFGMDLTEKAKKGKLPKIVGRDREIETAMQTLLLTENANPLLVGEAGVGKTAIVGGVAQSIADGLCPKKLRSKRIIELYVGGLVADTRLRGEFEQRIQELLAVAIGKGVVLFIDEIHTIVGAGAGGLADGLDVGNMLKGAMARGNIRIIGATTPAEFKRTIARDKALSRRFQQQIINPPSREATIRILTSVTHLFENYHGVQITDSAIMVAVDLSGRYIHDKQWPAKARDVLDRACVIAGSEADCKEGVGFVEEKHAAKVVAELTGLPLERVSVSEQKVLEKLEERLNYRIVGQPEAVGKIADAIRRGRQGLTNINRPWGVFLFLGSSGVGKTELAKVLAEEVFGGPLGLIRFDMGNFTEPNSSAKMVGAPAGYIGYNQGAPLVEQLRSRPHSLLLFDEIEHAHENVLAVLLRLFSEGKVVDTDGIVADARNSIVILTTNILGQKHRFKSIGFAQNITRDADVRTDEEFRSLLLDHMPSKLIDCLDSIILFRDLSLEHLETITRRKVSELVARIDNQHGVSVEVSREVYRWLAENSANAKAGARDIQRYVDQHVASMLSQFMMSGNRISVPLRIQVVDEAIRVIPIENKKI